MIQLEVHSGLLPAVSSIAITPRTPNINRCNSSVVQNGWTPSQSIHTIPKVHQDSGNPIDNNITWYNSKIECKSDHHISDAAAPVRKKALSRWMLRVRIITTVSEPLSFVWRSTVLEHADASDAVPLAVHHDDAPYSATQLFSCSWWDRRQR
jgi:hypothetical protein